MAIANTGAISFDTIQTEFGGTNPIGLNEYYAGGSFVNAGISGTNGAVPSSGAISMNQFFGTAKPPAAGQQAYTTSGTYSWVAPAGVTSVSAVAVGPGRNAGGGLGYRNNISVTAGNSYTVVVGQGGGVNASQNSFTDSYFLNGSTVRGGHGAQCAGGGYTGDGGGNGGRQNGGPNGGAGGYSGDGGAGAFATIVYGSITNRQGSPGAGGGGGGGGSSRNYVSCCATSNYSGGGGGVGLLGQGSNGAGGLAVNCYGGGGGGGSGGTNGSPSAPCSNGNGGAYGGGGRCPSGPSGGGNGAVRIIWPGTARTFPSTRTANE